MILNWIEVSLKRSMRNIREKSFLFQCVGLSENEVGRTIQKFFENKQKKKKILNGAVHIWRLKVPSSWSNLRIEYQLSWRHIWTVSNSSEYIN